MRNIHGVVVCVIVIVRKHLLVLNINWCILIRKGCCKMVHNNAESVVSTMFCHIVAINIPYNILGNNLKMLNLVYKAVLN